MISQFNRSIFGTLVRNNANNFSSLVLQKGPLTATRSKLISLERFFSEKNSNEGKIANFSPLVRQQTALNKAAKINPEEIILFEDNVHLSRSRRWRFLLFAWTVFGALYWYRYKIEESERDLLDSRRRHINETNNTTPITYTQIGSFLALLYIIFSYIGLVKKGMYVHRISLSPKDQMVTFMQYGVAFPSQKVTFPLRAISCPVPRESMTSGDASKMGLFIRSMDMVQSKKYMYTQPDIVLKYISHQVKEINVPSDIRRIAINTSNGKFIQPEIFDATLGVNRKLW